MPWVRFDRDFDYSPPSMGGRVTIAYKRGHEVNVTRGCAKAAKDAGVAVTIKARRPVRVPDEDPK